MLAERAPRRRSPLTQEKPATLDELWALIHTGRAVDVLPEFMVSPMVGNGVCAIPLVDVGPFEFALARRAQDRRGVVSALFDTARRLDQEASGTATTAGAALPGDEETAAPAS